MTDAEKIEKIRQEAEKRAQMKIPVFTRHQLYFISVALRHIDLKDMQMKNVHELRHASLAIVSTNDINRTARKLSGLAFAESEDPQAEEHPDLREIIDMELDREPQPPPPVKTKEKLISHIVKS